nr:peroxisomal membrane protein pex29 [Quercus suber]
MNNRNGATTVANRKDPIPIIPPPAQHDGTPNAEASGDSAPDVKDMRKRDKFKNRIMSRLDSYGISGNGSASSLQDKLFDSLMGTMLPAGANADLGSDDEITDAGSKTKNKKKKGQDKKVAARPNFSPVLMGQYLRRFNARIGVLFVFEAELIDLFTWRRPTATVAFLATYTILCLKPHLLLALPLFGVLLVVMIPPFVARHPVPENDPRLEPDYKGPPSAPASRMKPAEATSRDFWRNMRDLQNIMEDFSRLHDSANVYITPFTNFSDEGISTLIFVVVFVLMNLAFVASGYVPYQMTALLVGWGLTFAGHPSVTAVLTSPKFISLVQRQVAAAQEWIRMCIEADIILDSAPERRQVEIFELQRYHVYTDTWEPWLFSPSPHDPLSPARISGARPKGTQFFEDVQAPAAWTWKDKKWMLDLASQEWVAQRMITGVEIETQGERWVYDISEEELEKAKSLKGGKGSTKGKGKALPKSGWEEATGLERRGDWRRRRWVRVVERKAIDDSGFDG